MPGGRPIKFTAELKDAYCHLLAVGTGRRAAAAEVGVSFTTVADHRKGDAEFREACEDAEARANQPVVKATWEAACRGEPWAVKLWLTNRDSGNWREKVEVGVSGTVEHTVPSIAEVGQLAATLDARLAALESGPGGVSAEVAALGAGAEVIDADSWEETDAAL